MGKVSVQMNDQNVRKDVRKERPTTPSVLLCFVGSADLAAASAGLSLANHGLYTPPSSSQRAPDRRAVHRLRASVLQLRATRQQRHQHNKLYPLVLQHFIQIFTMAGGPQDLSELEKDPRLFLYTSLTAGSSHIITATSRMETILKANRIPFQAVDTATDEKARRLWGRRAGKRKLPGLVKDGFVIGVCEF